MRCAFDAESKREICVSESLAKLPAASNCGWLLIAERTLSARKTEVRRRVTSRISCCFIGDDLIHHSRKILFALDREASDPEIGIEEACIQDRITRDSISTIELDITLIAGGFARPGSIFCPIKGGMKLMLLPFSTGTAPQFRASTVLSPTSTTDFGFGFQFVAAYCRKLRIAWG